MMSFSFPLNIRLLQLLELPYRQQSLNPTATMSGSILHRAFVSRSSRSKNPGYSYDSKSPRRPSSITYGATVLPKARLNMKSTGSDSPKQSHLSWRRNVIMKEAERILGPHPMDISDSTGCKLYDVEGREYLDFCCFDKAFGHSDPDIDSAFIAERTELTAVVLGPTGHLVYSLLQVGLVKRLLDRSFADHVIITNSGTRAIEAAMEFARQFQRSSHPNEKKPPLEFLAFNSYFHGRRRTMRALALTSNEHYYRSPLEPQISGVTFLEHGDIEGAVELIQSGRFAAVFVEPIEGQGNTREFLNALRVACDEAGSLLVFEEVQCGLGRTGHLWAHEAYCVYPDIMTLAEPLAHGLTIGAVLMTERVSSSISDADDRIIFRGSPDVCKVATVLLDKLSKPKFLADVLKKGQYFKQLLIKYLRGKPHVKAIRGMGLLIDIELDVPALSLVDACRRSGLLVSTVGEDNVVRLVSPLIISEEELSSAAQILLDCHPVLDESM